MCESKSFVIFLLYSDFLFCIIVIKLYFYRDIIVNIFVRYMEKNKSFFFFDKLLKNYKEKELLFFYY